MKFSKLHGLGNDFVLLDATSQNLDLCAANIRKIANRHLGIGCDQVLVIKKITENTYGYRIFNADGSEVTQCGNGARCAALYLYKNNLCFDEIILKTENRDIKVRIDNPDSITVNMGAPDFAPNSIPLNVSLEKTKYPIFIKELNLSTNFIAMSLGNPHAVFVVDNFDKGEINFLGEYLNKNELFPLGVNVGFLLVESQDKITLRIYERGVGETSACGSGACAGVVAAHMLGLIKETVKVKLLGGELTINWQGVGYPIWMQGAATYVFDGEYRG